MSEIFNESYMCFLEGDIFSYHTVGENSLI